MARSYSDSSEESDSDSPKEETIYDTIRATAQKPGGARAEEGQAHMLVLRIVIEDLQQTVSPLPTSRPLAGVTWAPGASACPLPPPHKRPARPSCWALLPLPPPCSPTVGRDGAQASAQRPGLQRQRARWVP